MKLYIAAYCEEGTSQWDVNGYIYETIGVFSEKEKCYNAFANYYNISLEEFNSKHKENLDEYGVSETFYIEECELDKDYYQKLKD